ncbi:MAG: FMN-binding protein [Ruminococcus sp.]|nr:FMN-binding protein [Ruminococcus sp.]
MKKILPTIVLILVCAVFTGLLVVAHDLTYKDETGIITEEVAASLAEIYGESDGFLTTEVINEDNGITMIMQNEQSAPAYLMTVSGYNKNGITLVVGLSPDGSVKGISVVSLSETPGLGTKVADMGFLSQFAGFTPNDIKVETADSNADLPVRWGTKAEINALSSEKGEDTSGGFSFDAVTGATLSSNGVKYAVERAVAHFSENGGVSQ